MQMLDLVALATVADVAPLIGVNRAFVRQGLRIMAQRKRPGMTALADCANLQSPPSSYHLGFVLGPRINAGGRVGQSDLGAKLLICDDPPHAQALAERLEELNQDRRDVEESVRLAAIDQASERGLEGPLVWAAGAGWHPGVVGIVAARLKEATNRPAIVIGFDGNSGKGSGRSVSGVDLGATIQKLVQEGMIEKGGGHKMAAGLIKADFPESHVGDLPCDMVPHVFYSLAEHMQANLHIAVTGENTHHMVEACFKGFGRALRQAIRIEGTEMPSTKGTL